MIWPTPSAALEALDRRAGAANLPVVIRLPRSWDTASAALAACVGVAPAEIAAASGLAFRVTTDQHVTLAGPHAWPWRSELPAAAERLGFATRLVACDEPSDSQLATVGRTRAAHLIAEGLAAGRPTIIWGVHAPEFGLAIGLDGDRLQVSGILDGVAPAEMSLADLGRGDVPVLFALQLGELTPISDEESARSALRCALLAGRGPTPIISGFARGLDAWAAVKRALEAGEIDPAGLAYFAQRHAESRAAIAAFIPRAAQALAITIDPSAFRRSAGMLAELASCHPFPPPPDSMITSNQVDQSLALIDETARAEAAALDAIETALSAHQKSRAARLTVIDTPSASALFACTADLSLPLETQTSHCREQQAPRLGSSFRALLLQDGERTVGQLLHAPLSESLYPISAEGTRWLIFCPWVSRDRRGRGLGTRLFSALIDRARAAHIDGLLALATTDERFLDPAGFLKHGFTEVARRGELRLLELPLTDRPSCARIIDPIEPPRTGALPITVRHAYNCPLLLAARENVVAASVELPVALDTRDATAQDPAGVTVGGRPLMHGFVPVSALTHALRDAASRWS
jgi:GNAT superfamily N-acetyltransferase